MKGLRPFKLPLAKLLQLDNIVFIEGTKITAF